MLPSVHGGLTAAARGQINPPGVKGKTCVPSNTPTPPSHNYLQPLICIPLQPKSSLCCQKWVHELNRASTA